MTRDPHMPLLVPSDVRLINANSVPIEIQHRLGAASDDVILTRPTARLLAQVIDENAARFLEEFRRPTPIVDAVLSYAATEGRDPTVVLDEAFDLLCTLQRAGFLVPADAPEASSVVPFLEIGARFQRATVVRCLNLLSDAQVYELVDSSGDRTALKLVPPAGAPAARELLCNEVRVLSYLGGQVSPTLLGSGEYQEALYAVLSWCDGMELLQLCARRRFADWYDITSAFAMCTSILRSYERLHALGVVHGDVNLRNILVGTEYEVRILDFGLSRIREIRTHGTKIRRGGVGFFLDPEYALSCLSGVSPPAVTPSSEQYSIAALLYRVLCGCDYLDFRFDRRQFLMQITEEAPVPLRLRGMDGMEGVEVVLFKALSKGAGDRFCSVEEFRVAFESACTETGRLRDDRVRPSMLRLFGRDRCADLLRKYRPLDGERWAASRPPPTASVNFGAAGIALGLYHVACVMHDADCLSAAYAWAQRAIREMKENGGLIGAEAGISPESVESISLYHGAPGIYLVDALLASSRGDRGAFDADLGEFITTSAQPARRLDLTIGIAGTLLGCALLWNAASLLGAETRGLGKLGEKTVGKLSKWLGKESGIPNTGPGWLGMAHGTAGLVYAILMWCDAVGTERPEPLIGYLEQLSSLARRSGRGISWPQRYQDGQPRGSTWPGWCHGSSGYIHLWTLVHRLYGEDRFLDLAEGSAWYTWKSGDMGGRSLCCGYAGEAYGLLNLYRYTGRREWRDRAGQLAAKARRAAPAVGEREDSLYKGELGIMVLTEDLANPDTSCMPGFEIGS